MVPHNDALLGSILGATSGTALAVQDVAPPGAPWWAAWSGALIVTLAPLIVKMLLEARKTRRRKPQDEDDHGPK